MAGRDLIKRLTVLEGHKAGFPAKWHWIRGQAGETVDQARSRYAAEGNPIDNIDGAIVWSPVAARRSACA